uniref:Uncharacterized protein n=1 Tax=Romanomermis culicivorax TaxID=13658 RepID=A0A915KEZ4_ROMCU
MVWDPDPNGSAVQYPDQVGSAIQDPDADPTIAVFWIRIWIRSDQNKNYQESRIFN